MPCRGRVQFLPLPLFLFFLTGRCSFGGSLLQSVLYMWFVTIYVMCAGGGCGFPSNGKTRWDGMGGLGTTPSIESVRCCGIAVNLQETPLCSLLVSACSVVQQLNRAFARISFSVPPSTRPTQASFSVLHELCTYLKITGPFWRQNEHD